MINILRINCAPSWLYLEDYIGTRGQQNIKKPQNPEILFFTSDIKFASQLYVQTSPRITRMTMNRLFQNSVSKGERNRNKICKDIHRHTISVSLSIRTMILAQHDTIQEKPVFRFYTSSCFDIA